MWVVLLVLLVVRRVLLVVHRYFLVELEGEQSALFTLTLSRVILP